MPKMSEPISCAHCGTEFIREKTPQRHCSAMCHFLSKVRVDEASGCWLWTTKSRDPHGYGRIHVFGESHRADKASRVAWEIFRGPIDPGSYVCHKCDNPPCVNPDHLFLGSQLENIQDAKGKDRLCRGEMHPDAILDEARVEEIRRLYSKGGISQERLAERFGITSSHVSHIVNYRAWSDGREVAPTKPRAKLTQNDVDEIRELVRTRKETQRSLAKRFGVSEATISMIVNRKNWR